MNITCKEFLVLEMEEKMVSGGNHVLKKTGSDINMWKKITFPDKWKLSNQFENITCCNIAMNYNYKC